MKRAKRTGMLGARLPSGKNLGDATLGDLRGEIKRLEEGGPGATSSMKPSVRLPPAPLSTEQVIDLIRTQGNCRRQFHSAEKRLTLQMKAILRSLKRDAEEVGDEEAGHSSSEAHASDAPSRPHESEEGAAGQTSCGARYEPAPAPSSDLDLVLMTLDEHRASLKKSRLQHERILADLAEHLPVWSEWLAGVRGCGPLGLALIVAETGDLSLYANPAKVWKRLGLAVIGGERQRRVTDAKEALLHGYSPRRRAVAWNLGEAFVKQGDRYRELYLQRKVIEAAKPPCGKKWKTPAGGMKACEKDGRCRPSHVHARARRWVEKKFLADLWGAWNHKPAPEP